MNYRFESNSSNETISFAENLVKNIKSGTSVCFFGDLGAGKTTFIKGLAKGLNVKDVVQSPTFNIMKIYFSGDRPLIHIDAYRLADNDADIGLDEYIGYEEGITVIEWPMYIEKLLPKKVVKITINYLSETKRIYEIEDEANLIEGK